MKTQRTPTASGARPAALVLPAPMRRLAAIACQFLLLTTALTTDALAFNPACQADGGDMECIGPKVGDWYCSAGGGGHTSFPQCTMDGVNNTGSCKSEGDAIATVSNKWRDAVPLCSGPTFARNNVSDSLSRYIGVDQWFVHHYDVTVTPQSSVGGCHPSSTVNNGNGQCLRAVECPPTYGLVSSPNQSEGYCARRISTCQNGECSGGAREGNPIQLTGGEKTNREPDIAPVPGSLLQFTRYYSSTGFYTPTNEERRRDSLGQSWRHSFQQRIVMDPGRTSAAQPAAVAVRDHGAYRHFRLVAGVWTARTDAKEILTELTDGSGTRTGWRLITAEDDTEDYDAAGRLLSIATLNGLRIDISYSNASTSTTVAPYAGLPILIEDGLGRYFTLTYDSRGKLSQVTTQDGQIYGYRYEPHYSRLSHVDYPDQSTRGYLYNEAGLVGYNRPAWDLLTGIVDENGQRFATYKYNTQGAAYEEWHGSANANYLKVEFVTGFSQDLGIASYTDALGLKRTKRFQDVNGAYRLTRLDQPSCAGAGCTPTTHSTSTTYDSKGLRDLVTDFRGTVTDYDHGARAVETQRIEAKTVAGVSGTPPEKRTTQTDWHANFRLPVERRLYNASNALEAKSQWAYNSRGQVVARCEIDINDSAAMAYSCSDTTAPAAGARVRRWTYAYCEAGDVAASNSTCPILGYSKSVNGPRLISDAGMNGLDDITSYAYYPSTDESGCGTLSGPCHRKGDLHTVTNALGHVTENVTYDKTGRVVRSRDPNGTLTDAAYNTRGWMTSRTIRALASGASNADDATTGFTYNSAGMVTRVTQPDGAYLNYSYDDAHRLTDVVDNLSNRIHYTLDAAGNRVKEETFDSSYNPATPGVGLKRAMSRQYNALGRLVRELNAANAATRDSTPYDSGGLSDGFDPSGNRTHFKDGLDVQTLRAFDPLNRLVKTIQDYAGTDPETSSATTEFSYDARDNLRTVKDPNNLTTTYIYDGLGNLTDLDSPDTGHTDYAYDFAANRTSKIDNRGVLSTYTFDALNRLGATTYPTSSLNITIHHDDSNTVTGCASSYPLGRITRMIDTSGATIYCYDRRGNISTKTQVTAGATLTVDYTYTRADRPATITYPSGGVATYSYDTTGRSTALTWKATTSSTPITVIGDISYYPFGPASVMTFGNNRTLTKIYDSDYAIDSIASSATDGIKLDFDVDVVGNIISASETLGASPPLRRYVYDKLYRLTQVNDSNGAMLENFNYNKTGDRTLKQVFGQPAQIYTYLSGSHHLGSAAGVNRTYDANGNTTNRGDGTTLAFDDRNRLVSAATPSSTATYEYSGRGERTFKVRADSSNTVTNRFVYSEEAQILADHEIATNGPQGGEIVEYLYIKSIPVAVSRPSGLSYVESDHLATPRLAANATTNMKEWEWSFFGKAFGDSAAVDVVPGRSVNLRFAGQYRDVESGLHHNYFRDFDPQTGRYVESDPIGLAGGLSTFGYVKSNPTRYNDPLGLMVKRCCRKAQIIFGLVSHCWIKTETATAGMNGQATCSHAGNGAAGYPLMPVYVSDHTCEIPDNCEDYPDVDEECVNKELVIGREIGRFHPLNNCQTFAWSVLTKCQKNQPPRPKPSLQFLSR